MRDGAGDLEEPDEVVLILLAQRTSWRLWRVEVHGGPDAVGENQVKPGALIYFVEMRQRAAGVELLAGGVEGWGTVYIVEQAFDEVGCGDEVLETLLVLDADGSQPNSSAMRRAAMYILHCWRPARR